jgi:ubiquinone/menaquinone biosynthesis C-methylase UbiE
VASTLTAEEIRDVNTRYHDVAADHYDAKWGIDFGDLGADQVTAKVRKALGDGAPERFERTLEIGAGTGYFTLNMLRAGMIGRATCSDISPGMLATLQANARRLDLEVSTKAADAEQLPFADGSFDLVFGHAVLHHIPDLQRAFAEFARVLEPGGRIVFAGEPSRYGDRLADVPKRAAGAPGDRGQTGTSG